MNRLAAAVLASLAGLGLFAADRVRFAIGEWEPYTGQNMEAYGMASEVVTAACAATGLKVEYEFFPWKRAEANVQRGTHFATFPYQETADREPKYYFSDSLCRSTNGILLHRGNARIASFSYANPEDLKGFRVGTLAGSDAINLPLRNAGAEVEEVQNVEQNLKKLEMNYLDCVIDDRPVLHMAVKKLFGADLAKRSEFYLADKGFGGVTDYKLMVSRTYPNARDLLARFNAGLKLIKANGEYPKILKKYGM